MSVWSSLAKALSKLAKGGGGKVAASGAAEAAGAGAKVVLTWGNTIKVAVVGCFSYLFLTGGLSNVVSTTLGIPEEVAQVIIVVVFVFLLAVAIRYLVNYAKDRMNLKQEYFDTPIFSKRGSDGYENRGYPRVYEQHIEPYDRMLYDGGERGRLR